MNLDTQNELEKLINKVTEELGKIDLNKTEESRNSLQTVSQDLHSIDLMIEIDARFNTTEG